MLPNNCYTQQLLRRYLSAATIALLPAIPGCTGESSQVENAAALAEDLLPPPASIDNPALSDQYVGTWQTYCQLESFRFSNYGELSTIYTVLRLVVEADSAELIEQRYIDSQCTEYVDLYPTQSPSKNHYMAFTIEDVRLEEIYDANSGKAVARLSGGIQYSYVDHGPATWSTHRRDISFILSRDEMHLYGGGYSYRYSPVSQSLNTAIGFVYLGEPNLLLEY